MSRRLTSLPSVAPTIRPRESTASTTSGSGLFQAESPRTPTCWPGTDRGEDRRLGEDLRIRADPDLEVLRPPARGDQFGLERRGPRRSWLDRGKVRADGGSQLLADASSLGGVTTRTLLDDPLDQARGEGHAAGPHDLEVEGREQMRLVRHRVACDGWPRPCRPEARRPGRSASSNDWTRSSRSRRSATVGAIGVRVEDLAIANHDRRRAADAPRTGRRPEDGPGR